MGILKLSDLDALYEDLIQRGARPGEVLSIDRVDHAIAVRHGIGDVLIRNIKKKLVDFGYLKFDNQYPGFFILVDRRPKKSPEAELNALTDSLKGSKPEA